MNELKQRASRLDPYVKELLEMEAKHMTLMQMVRWLEERGVSTADTTLSAFLRKHRKLRESEQFTELIRSCAQQCREAEKMLDENPAPSVETLVKIFRLLIMKLVKDGSLQPKFVRLADQLARTAIRDRELAIEEAKFAETQKNEHTRALELCLGEAKKFPQVMALFRDAFAALLKVKPEPSAPPVQVIALCKGSLLH